MNRYLIPVDGSATSDKAVAYLIEKRALRRNADAMEIHLLNVQHPVSGDVSTFVDPTEISQYHHDKGLEALRSACALFDQAGLPYTRHVGLGEPAEVIARYAGEMGCDHIVIGTHGRSALANAFLGSVAIEVVRLSRVPVTLIK